jgi:hypothetical protein
MNACEKWIELICLLERIKISEVDIIVWDKNSSFDKFIIYDRSFKHDLISYKWSLSWIFWGIWKMKWKDNFCIKKIRIFKLKKFENFTKYHWYIVTTSEAINDYANMASSCYDVENLFLTF